MLWIQSIGGFPRAKKNAAAWRFHGGATIPDIVQRRNIARDPGIDSDKAPVVWRPLIPLIYSNIAKEEETRSTNSQSLGDYPPHHICQIPAFNLGATIRR